MASTVFTDYSTPIVAAWLNTINQAVYQALGLTDAGPFTGAQVLSNINGVSQTTFSAYQTLLAGATGSTQLGFTQAGLSAITVTVQTKLREIISAQDFGAAGVSTVVDAAAIQAAAAAANAAGGGQVKINRFISQSIDLTTLSLPTNVTFVDERYSINGWQVTYNSGTDAQITLQGTATTTGEGPTVVLQNIASTGNRNVSFAYWYGPPSAPVVGSYEHMGFNADGSWYPGREWLGSGSIDSGFRARVRWGGDGTFIVNPNGNAASFQNNPAQAFTQGYIYVINAPLQTGYANSAKYLFGLNTGKLDLGVELRVQAGARIALQTGTGPTATDRWGLLQDFPSTGQMTIYDYIAGVSKITCTSGSSTAFNGGISFVSQTAASAPNNTLFVDSADNKLKFKGASGTVTVLALP